MVKKEVVGYKFEEDENGIRFDSFEPDAPPLVKWKDTWLDPYSFKKACEKTGEAPYVSAFKTLNGFVYTVKKSGTCVLCEEEFNVYVLYCLRDRGGANMSCLEDKCPLVCPKCLGRLTFHVVGLELDEEELKEYTDEELVEVVGKMANRMVEIFDFIEERRVRGGGKE